MNNDLISREALKKKLTAIKLFGGAYCKAITEKDIDNAPTAVDVKGAELAYNNGYKHAKEKYKRPQGEWTIYNAYYKTCPFCKRTVGVDFLIQSYENPPKGVNFCPNCGADMRKGGAE